MVKKKLLALGVSAVAVTAVVGAGFAGWTFTSEAKKEQGFGINVTAAYSFGTVAIDTNAPDTVVLDQSCITLAKTGALNTAIANVTAKWTVATTSYEAQEAKLAYSVNVYVKDGLSTYVNCGESVTGTASTADDKVVGTGYTKYVVTPTTTDTISGDNTVVTMTLANPLAYTASKPDTFEKYQAMVDAIQGNTVSDGDSSTITTDTEYTVAATDKPVVIEFVVTKTTD